MNKQLLLYSILAFAWFVLAAFVAPRKTYTVDVQQSTIKWTGKKVTGEHTGTLQLKQGNITIDDNQLTGGSFTVDMASLDNEDLSGEDKAKLEGHLKSDDFFGVANHPEAILEITDVQPKGSNQYEVTGDLTIKGSTKPVTFPATVRIKNGKLTAEASLEVDRTKYDIRYGSGSFFDALGDNMIYDNFELQVSLVANQQ